jgi:hypothetical protein
MREWTHDRDDAEQDSPCPVCGAGPLELKGYGMVCPDGHILDEEDEEESDVSNPVAIERVCDCDDDRFPGVAWPMASNGDDSRSWVERCDNCERYPNDEEAAAAVIVELDRQGRLGEWGHDKVFGGGHDNYPYVEEKP